jgi:hypothetical protein
MSNRTIWFPRRQQKLQGRHTSNQCGIGGCLEIGGGGNRDQIGPRSETSANDEAKHEMEKGPEEVAVKQDKTQGEETDIRAEAVASS